MENEQHDDTKAVEEEEENVTTPTSCNRPVTTVKLASDELAQLKQSLVKSLQLNTTPTPTSTTGVSTSETTTPTSSLKKSILPTREVITPVSHYIKPKQHIRKAKKSTASLAQLTKKKISSSLTLYENRWKMVGVFDHSQMETYNIAMIGNSFVGKKTLATKFTGVKLNPMFRMKSEGNMFYRMIRVNASRLIEVNFSHILHADNSYTMDHLNEYLNNAKVDAYILCFSVDEKSSFDVLKNSVADQLNNSGTPIYLCGTKAETPHEYREVSFKQARELCNKIPNCKGFFETSVVRKGDRIIGYDNEDDDDDEEIVATEDSSGGVDYLMYEVLKDVHNARFHESRFSMSYLTISGEEFEPYIPQLEQFIDVYSTAADVVEEEEEPEYSYKPKLSNSAPNILEGVGGAGLLRDLANKKSNSKSSLLDSTDQTESSVCEEEPDDY